ncbi:hypothetical protein [Photorhabdus bodei]|uniref:Uncharacterized protein n=1 Tax=Photorhabdus bodei TaxID=2029681 RepID=A0A329XBV6_9GAMM|nr:hypothetical protein [Photorhabdus bodei]NDK98988.1 hypothetical protein [Photorhabdus bodei]NDL03332.1 hypothetical protein [Photorhabdus bodei]NDL07446.1 hypothetical protein [Photorhabdus bodei]RAX14061.1 hypothetical protein CKY02_01870 [Photorhabdus bodei]
MLNALRKEDDLLYISLGTQSLPNAILNSANNDKYVFFSNRSDYAQQINEIANLKAFSLQQQPGMKKWVYHYYESLFRVKQLYINIHKITDETTLDEFKIYLKEIDVGYDEIYENNQLVLKTNENIF